MMDIFAGLAAKAAALPEEGDYMQDGLLYCGKCRTPKQARVEFGGSSVIVGCMCSCRSAEYDRQRELDKAEQERLRIKQLRSECVQDHRMGDMTFQKAEPAPIIERAQKYVENWERVYAAGAGLLLWGPPSSGKTYAAASIGNALIDRGIPVLMTSFPIIGRSSFEDQAALISSINRYRLVIVDDIGVERQSDYVLETVYTIIDQRVRARLPLILTTNLSEGEFRNPRDMAHARIYERILERCQPVEVAGFNWRARNADNNFELMKEIFTK